MTNNPTIDGVSRELLLNKCACGSADISFCYESPKGHWILCDECGEASPSFENKGSALDHWNKRAPAVERQEPTIKRFNTSVSHGGSYEHVVLEEHRSGHVMRSNDVVEYVAALQSTIAQLEDKLNKAIDLDFQRRETIARLEGKVQELESGRGEPVAWAERRPDGGYWEDSFRQTAFDDGVPLYEAAPSPVAVMVLPKYTCIGKGGEYELMGSAIGAGTLKEMSPIPVYRDTTTGQLFVRTPLDFSTRMACLDATAALNGERK